MFMLSSVLVNEASPMHVRNAAGLALKNALTARVSHFLLPFILAAPVDF
jgi:importin subunit beta-1